MPDVCTWLKTELVFLEITICQRCIKEQQQQSSKFHRWSSWSLHFITSSLHLLKTGRLMWLPAWHGCWLHSGKSMWCQPWIGKTNLCISHVPWTNVSEGCSIEGVQIHHSLRVETAPFRSYFWWCKKSEFGSLSHYFQAFWTIQTVVTVAGFLNHQQVSFCKHLQAKRRFNSAPRCFSQGVGQPDFVHES